MRITPTFGDWIKSKRKERHLTALECAERVGMKQSVWSRWESDESRRADGKPSQPRRETVEAIARALDLPVWEALAAAGYASAEKMETEEELTRLYFAIPAHKRPAFKRAVRSIAEALAAA